MLLFDSGIFLLTGKKPKSITEKLTSYRPILLLMCKFLEKLILRILQPIIEENRTNSEFTVWFSRSDPTTEQVHFVTTMATQQGPRRKEIFALDYF